MTAAFMVFGTIFICVYLWWLERFNRRCYRTSLQNPQRYSLSERFQIQENIKTTRIINSVASMVLILNFLIASLVLAAQFFETEIFQKFAYNFFHIGITIYGYCLALAAIAANPLWFHNFRRLAIPPIPPSIYCHQMDPFAFCPVFIFAKQLNFDPLFFRIFTSAIKITPVGISNSQQRVALSKQLLNHSGQRMLFTLDEEKDLYFVRLNNQWS